MLEWGKRTEYVLPGPSWVSVLSRCLTRTGPWLTWPCQVAVGWECWGLKLGNEGALSAKIK
nr:hypothetical protein Q903MT_gene353 [Picea sitchensis]